MKVLKRIADLPGVLVRDLVRYEAALSHSGRGYRSDDRGWISICNRTENLTAEVGQPGVRCNWLWGSALHAAEVLPSLGRSVMRRSLDEWPIEFASQPRVVAAKPKLSFIFAHAGNDRLPQLRRTIRSIYAQVDVPCEVVVVDQSPVPLLGALPIPVVYRHLERPAGVTEFHKTIAYNVGARLASGPILVFHDGDVCAPALYAQELVKAIDKRGFGAASLQRFLYYLDPADTKRVDSTDAFGGRLTPSMIFQNWKGGTIAITRDGFCAIGGFDEGFIGWGGEDAEFFDRCMEVRHCRSGYLPFVHLWHPPQPSKSGHQRDVNVDFFHRRMEEPRPSRIRRLRGGA